MDATNSFFIWWFEQWGIGGWVIFFLVAVAAIAWIIYDSQSRRIRALGWLMGAILPALLLIPSIIFGFSATTQDQLQNLQETFFYIGLIGGIVPVVVAVGYGITYQGMRGCEHGHVYDAALGACPLCAPPRVEPVPEYRPAPDRTPPAPPPVSPAPPARPPANAWLLNEGANRTHQLNQGDTRVGRGKQANHIVLGDRAVSREHILIREDRGHFTIYDRGSRTGTYVNGRRLEGPLMLAHDDLIEIGDTRLRFVTSRR
ncbi:MAG: FHA domain-containing protein [Chloroflexia bacterium]|nr:FHA domain-containing protein [Chloroflexia bacterium]